MESSATSPSLIRMHVVSDSCLVLDHVRGNWDRSLFLVIPLRLGLDFLQEEHVPGLLEFFSFPQCLGLLGGTPRHALYLVGVRSDQSLLCLDPHTTQSALGHTKRSFFSRGSSCDSSTGGVGMGLGACLGRGSAAVVDAAEDAEPKTEEAREAHRRTMHGAPLDSIAPSALDPSLAVGFLCRSEDDLEDLLRRTRTMRTRGGRPLFDIMESAPVWEGRDAATQWEWESVVSDRATGGGADGDDEDEFVLL